VVILAQIWRKKSKDKTPSDDNLNKAEKKNIRDVQSEYFLHEIELLQQNRNIPK